MTHLRVKVCGITSLDDALWAIDAGADALGLIFVEGTPRYVTPAAAAAIVAELPPFVCPVGVFWDHPPAHVAAIVAEWRLGAGPFPGAQPPDVVPALPVPVLKPTKLRDAQALAQLDRYKPAAFLLDSPARWSEGAARAPISWTLARAATSRGRVILAGGLTPETVSEAVRTVRPWGGGVNSGVEAAPGRARPAEGARGIPAARAAAARAVAA